jgi:hypothetical protein
MCRESALVGRPICAGKEQHCAGVIADGLTRVLQSAAPAADVMIEGRLFGFLLPHHCNYKAVPLRLERVADLQRISSWVTYTIWSAAFKQKGGVVRNPLRFCERKTYDNSGASRLREYSDVSTELTTLQ